MDLGLIKNRILRGVYDKIVWVCMAAFDLVFHPVFFIISPLSAISSLTETLLDSAAAIRKLLVRLGGVQ
jgi:hypothetical protein